MKITEVNIPMQSIKNDGLSDIKMSKLENVILITGKNGSGKSRLLRKISSYCKKKLGYSEETTLLKYIAELKAKLSENYSDSTYSSPIKKDLEDALKKIEVSNYLSFSNPSEQYNIYEFVPKNVELTDPNTLSKNDLVKFSLYLDNIDIKNMSQGTLAKIQHIQNLYWEAKHPMTTLKPEETSEIEKSYLKLNDLIERFLSTKLTRSLSGDAELFGMPLGSCELSEGQKVLLQFCVSIFSNGTSLDDLILFMDEPENHLHPSAILQVIDTILDNVKSGQLWIATHSLTLLSHFDASSIWYIDNGSIKRYGRKPELILKSLLGENDQINRLRDFLNLPTELAMHRFAFQCLFDPKTVPPFAGDPQTNQIKNFLCNYKVSEKLRVLDCGAGKGRLLSSIYDSLRDTNIETWLDYIAFDTTDKDKKDCLQIISEAYPSTYNKRYFNTFDNILMNYDELSFDVVIMCNVLHEIPPIDWLNIFSKQSQILKILKPDGVLFLVEDQLIPIGEKAHKNGFIVLNTIDLKKLFSISETDTDFQWFDERSDGRLVAHMIPKKYLERISSETRVNALESVCNTSKTNIAYLRGCEPKYEIGLLHAFWTQQFANATLSLDELR